MIKSYRCLACGYIHIGSQPPQKCPVCGVSAEEFEIYEDQVKEEKQTDKVNTDILRVVIIGCGIAGLSCAKEIRNHSKTAEITIVSSDKIAPYYRLNLTKYLSKEVDKESLTIYPGSWYDEHKINLIRGKEVHEIDKDTKQIKIQDGSSITYDKLVITSGAYPFIPQISGNDLENVVTVWTLEDAEFIIEEMKKVKSCICIGGGILGLEVAGAIARSGIKVTLLEGSEWLMPKQLNKKAADILKKSLQNIGVEVIENTKIQEIIGKEVCEGVKLSTGEVLATKLLIITTGVRPNTHLARKTGLDVNMGLVVNNHMETSEKDIYAAGDVTEHNGILYGLWNVAQYQGKIAAQNTIGMNTEFRGIPRTNVLKVLGLYMFSIGEISRKDESYYEYEKEMDNRYNTFILRDDKIVGSIIIGDQTLSLKVKQAVEKELVFSKKLYDSYESILEKLLNGI